MENNAQNDALPTSSMADWIFQRLKLLSDEKGKTAAQIFADDGTSWTFEKLFQSSVLVSAGLKAAGINSGDMASIVARNTHELYAVVFGCVMSGVTLAPSIPELTPGELKENFLVVKPQIVIAGARFIPTVNEAIDGIKPKPKVLEVHQLFRDACAAGVQTDPDAFKPVHIKDPKSHVFTCAFSSGTTGKQKAVAITDSGLLQSLFRASQFPNTDIVGPAFNASQMFWISWWFIIIRSFFEGWTRVFMDDATHVNTLDAIQKYKISMIFGSPGLASKLVRALDANSDRWDTSSLRFFLMGGDICNKLTHEDIIQKLKVNIYQEYGSTESGLILQNRVGSPVVYGSSGKPLVPVKLVDVTTGEEITEPNKPGEVVVQVIAFSHYVNNPEATSGSFDNNGWLRMGDIAYFDDSGNYFIVDRIKEMFRSHSFQVSPSELEDIIKKLPGVKDVAVAGKPSLDFDFLPTAFIVRAKNSNITEKDVFDHFEKYALHDSKRLRGGVIFKNEIPRNVNGKIIRAKVRDFFNELQT